MASGVIHGLPAQTTVLGCAVVDNVKNSIDSDPLELFKVGARGDKFKIHFDVECVW
jgi:hypothetical protein